LDAPPPAGCSRVASFRTAENCHGSAWYHNLCSTLIVLVSRNTWMFLEFWMNP
jgi:hypothetical protein